MSEVPQQSGQEPITRSEFRLELKAFRAEQRLLVVTAVVFVSILNVAPDDLLKAVGAAGVLIGSYLAKLLWIRV